MQPMKSPEPRTGHPRPTSPKTAAVPLGAYSMRPFVRQAGVAQAWLGEKTPLASSYNLVRDDRRRRVALVRARARLARAGAARAAWPIHRFSRGSCHRIKYAPAACARRGQFL